MTLSQFDILLDDITIEYYENNCDREGICMDSFMEDKIVELEETYQFTIIGL